MNIDSYEYQYPPELLQMLIEVIPRLHRSKLDILSFFKTAGVDEADLQDLRRRVQNDRDHISTYEISRAVLDRLCDKKGAGLGLRRAVLQRITDWENFSTCWENNRSEAERLVSKIQKFVGSKDLITRMVQRDDEERRLRREEAYKQQAKILKQKDELATVRSDLASLFGSPNPHKRGKTLETVLNRYFKVSDIHVRDAFALTGSNGEGIIEQIDGVVELDGQIYLVEMKWWNEPVDVVPIQQHVSKLYVRAQANGIFISASGYTRTAIAKSREALNLKLIVLCELKEIVLLMEQEKSFKEFLRKKVHAAVIDKNPLYYPLR
jgi:restriction system protein